MGKPKFRSVKRARGLKQCVLFICPLARRWRVKAKPMMLMGRLTNRWNILKRGFAALFNQRSININLAHIIDYDGNFFAFTIIKHMIK